MFSWKTRTFLSDPKLLNGSVPLALFIPSEQGVIILHLKIQHETHEYNTRDQTCNNKCTTIHWTRPVIMSTQYTEHESRDNKAQVLTRPTDMGAITDQGNGEQRAHIYTY